MNSSELYQYLYVYVHSAALKLLFKTYFKYDVHAEESIRYRQQT